MSLFTTTMPRDRKVGETINIAWVMINLIVLVHLRSVSPIYDIF